MWNIISDALYSSLNKEIVGTTVFEQYRSLNNIFKLLAFIKLFDI